MLDDPGLGGGIRTVADVLLEYLHSDHRDDSLLVKYGDQLGNRAVFKRLGYLLEHSGAGTTGLIEACLLRRSSSLAKLDPSVQGTGRILRHWGLQVNVALGAPGGEWPDRWAGRYRDEPSVTATVARRLSAWVAAFPTWMAMGRARV